MKMDNGCFMKFNNQLYAIQNWYLRKNEFDVVLLDPLDTQEMGTHLKLSKQGLSEEHIYNALYPKVSTKPKEKVLIDIDLLTKEQLIHLICVGLNTSLPTLMYMSTDDLQKLYLVISTKSGFLNYAYRN
jgi:hypothetical protein